MTMLLTIKVKPTLATAMKCQEYMKPRTTSIQVLEMDISLLPQELMFNLEKLISSNSMKMKRKVKATKRGQVISGNKLQMLKLRRMWNLSNWIARVQEAQQANGKTSKDWPKLPKNSTLFCRVRKE